MRACAKSACGKPAVATLACRYAHREVWIGPLTAERDPNLFDLCAAHADRLTAPWGWRLRDDRTALLPDEVVGEVPALPAVLAAE